MNLSPATCNFPIEGQFISTLVDVAPSNEVYFVVYDINFVIKLLSFGN